MKAAILQKALELGFDACAVTSANPPQSAPRLLEWLEQDRHGQMEYLRRNQEKRVDPQKILPGAQSIVSVAVSYFSRDAAPSPRLANAIEPAPRGVIARYARSADYHRFMGRALEELARFIDELGRPAARSLWHTDTGPLLERDLAQRAGLGFIGKQTNLISRTLGNWVLLGQILTVVPLEADPPERNRCGTCSRCLQACPTQAITGPFQLDARRCIAYLTIELKGSIPEDLRPLIGNRIFGCDDCLQVCPWNRFAAAGRMMRAHARPDLDALDLIELLNLTEADFKTRFAGTPILRAKRRGLLRNVCVALGNSGDLRALPALQKAQHDPEPLIAEHACWAIAQIAQRRAAPPLRASPVELG